MTTEELLIHELAERAGISVRTIRYYIEEGLLPQPAYQGKYSYYTPNFLDRLELIRRLKESYLPLRQIREIMASLSDDEVRLKLNELPTTSHAGLDALVPAQPTGKPGENAIRYIDRLMEDQTRYKTKGPGNQPTDKYSRQPAVTSQPMFTSINEPPVTPDQESWQRITIAPGVELHLRTPMDSDVQYRIQQVVNFARRIFSSKAQGGHK